MPNAQPQQTDYTEYQCDNKWSKIMARIIDESDFGMIVETVWLMLLPNVGALIRIIRENTKEPHHSTKRILSDMMTVAHGGGIATRDDPGDKRCQIMGPGQDMMPKIIQAMGGMPPPPNIR
jgi:hypothetical protein